MLFIAQIACNCSIFLSCIHLTRDTWSVHEYFWFASLILKTLQTLGKLPKYSIFLALNSRSKMLTLFKQPLIWTLNSSITKLNHIMCKFSRSLKFLIKYSLDSRRLTPACKMKVENHRKIQANKRKKSVASKMISKFSIQYMCEEHGKFLKNSKLLFRNLFWHSYVNQ